MFTNGGCSNFICVTLDSFVIHQNGFSGIFLKEQERSGKQKCYHWRIEKPC